MPVIAIVALVIIGVGAIAAVTVPAIVKPDESAPIKELVKVMDTAKASGLKNIKLRTKPLEAPSAP